jgi:hypothetical protein
LTGFHGQAAVCLRRRRALRINRVVKQNRRNGNRCAIRKVGNDVQVKGIPCRSESSRRQGEGGRGSRGGIGAEYFRNLHDAVARKNIKYSRPRFFKKFDNGAYFAYNYLARRLKLR